MGRGLRWLELGGGRWVVRGGGIHQGRYTDYLLLKMCVSFLCVVCLLLKMSVCSSCLVCLHAAGASVHTVVKVTSQMFSLSLSLALAFSGQTNLSILGLCLH